MLNGQHTGIVSNMASVHPKAIIGNDVTIGPYSFIDKDVVIGDGTWIGPNVTIFSGARIGKGCRIFPGAVIAAIPQDLKFSGEETTAEIGNYTTIRECVTINRATKYAWKTTVGSNCLIMAYAHVAHDCQVGNHVILANTVQLAGHVEIEDFAILEGMVAVQQFVRIGAHSFVAGGSLVRKNVPPFVKVAREPLTYMGVNHIGLSRRGYDKGTIQQIKAMYHPIFVTQQKLSEAMVYLQDHFEDSIEQRMILQFIQRSSKGIVRGV